MYSLKDALLQNYDADVLKMIVWDQKKERPDELAEAAAERKKDIFDEPEQNSAVTWRAGDWTYQASFREETIFSRAAARSAFSL